MKGTEIEEEELMLTSQFDFSSNNTTKSSKVKQILFPLLCFVLLITYASFWVIV